MGPGSTQGATPSVAPEHIEMITLLMTPRGALPWLLQDDAFYVGVYRSRSDKFLFISSGSAVTSETLFLDADKPEGEFKVRRGRVGGGTTLFGPGWARLRETTPLSC